MADVAKKFLHRRVAGVEMFGQAGKMQIRSVVQNRPAERDADRAVILACGGPLEFDLPVKTSVSAPRLAPSSLEIEPREFLTESQMQLRHRQNIERALATANWKIKGVGGAAELLGLKPATLLSRIKKLGLQRTRFPTENR